jgi:hypothetical protein
MTCSSFRRTVLRSPCSSTAALLLLFANGCFSPNAKLDEGDDGNADTSGTTDSSMPGDDTTTAAMDTGTTAATTATVDTGSTSEESTSTTSNENDDSSSGGTADETDTAQPSGCFGTPTPCETFGFGEYDACIGVEGCSSVVACGGTPNVCAATAGCPGQQTCITNCEARIGCDPFGPLSCGGQQCWGCGGDPAPCEDVDEAGPCVLSGCHWAHQACEGTPAPCNMFDEKDTCETQLGCEWSD